MTSKLRVVKAHAYGNDFLLVAEGPRPDAGDGAALARRLCDRHRGIGADGLILYELRDRSASMRLFNADGSASELSGNGLRCLGAVVARSQSLKEGSAITVQTGAGAKRLDLVTRDGECYTFRAAMGQPEDVRQVSIPVAGDRGDRDGPSHGQPAVCRARCTAGAGAFDRLGPLLATHAMFPDGTNVEFAQVEAPDRVRILIWERGVGPTSSSGTGTCASAVAAAAHGGASREVDVVAPGGTQRVEWRDDGVYLTGWATLVFDGEWLGPVIS